MANVCNRDSGEEGTSEIDFRTICGAMRVIVFEVAEVECGVMVMAGKSFILMLLATLVGPAVGIGLFVLLNNL